MGLALVIGGGVFCCIKRRLNSLAKKEELRVLPFRVAQVERSATENNFSMQVSNESPTAFEANRMHILNEDSSNIQLHACDVSEISQVIDISQK